MKAKTRILALALALILAFSAVSCGKKLSTGKLPVEHETKFGGVNILITIEDICKLGFEYGDSVDVIFSNKYKLEDIPFYNGYYTRAGEPLLVAYPGYASVRACINYGDDLYEMANLTEDCTAKVVLNKRGTYLSTQNVMSMVYTNERGNYSSDEVFANFRAMKGGALAENKFYRAASPCDNQYNRAAYSSKLAADAGIGYVLDLADDAGEAENYYNDAALDIPYWKSLYESGKVLPLDMSANYRDEDFAKKTASAMRAVINEDGPFLIHCTEGKDRTGFICLLIEALAGASVGELEEDYMITYDNYYGVTKDSEPDGYNAVMKLKFTDMILCLCGKEELSKIETSELLKGAEDYLAFGGMTPEEIELLKKAVTA